MGEKPFTKIVNFSKIKKNSAIKSEIFLGIDEETIISVMGKLKLVLENNALNELTFKCNKVVFSVLIAYKIWFK